MRISDWSSDVCSSDLLTHHHINHIADVPVLMIDRWLLSSAEPLEVYGPPGSARLVLGTLRAFHLVELAPVRIGGRVKPQLFRTALAHDLTSKVHAPTPIVHEAIVLVIPVMADHFPY